MIASEGVSGTAVRPASAAQLCVEGGASAGATTPDGAETAREPRVAYSQYHRAARLQGCAGGVTLPLAARLVASDPRHISAYQCVIGMLRA